MIKAESNILKYETVLTKSNPKTLADKGFIKVLKNGKIIKSANELEIKDDVVLDFVDGNVNAQIVNKQTKRVE